MTELKDDLGTGPEPGTSLTIIEPTAVAIPTGTTLVPALIADLGDQAGWRYVEFFTANIRNPHTRRAYARACGQFFGWCAQHGLTLSTIRPHDVATYIEQLQMQASAPAAPKAPSPTDALNPRISPYTKGSMH